MFNSESLNHRMYGCNARFDLSDIETRLILAERNKAIGEFAVHAFNRLRKFVRDFDDLPRGLKGISDKTS